MSIDQISLFVMRVIGMIMFLGVFSIILYMLYCMFHCTKALFDQGEYKDYGSDYNRIGWEIFEKSDALLNFIIDGLVNFILSIFYRKKEID